MERGMNSRRAVEGYTEGVREFQPRVGFETLGKKVAHCLCRNPFRVCREKAIDSDQRISKLRSWGKLFVHMT